MGGADATLAMGGADATGAGAQPRKPLLFTQNVSRYFRYKTSEDLVAGARALGLGVELSADLSPLLESVDVGGRPVGNRLAIQPMEGCDGEPDGSPGELTFRRYAASAPAGPS